MDKKLINNKHVFKRFRDVFGCRSYRHVADLVGFGSGQVSRMRNGKQPISNALADSMKERFANVYGAIEAERRAGGDQNLFSYVNATFVPGKLVMPKDSICPSCMPEFNSWGAFQLQF